MFAAPISNSLSRLLPAVSLILLMSFTSGCATRALMSSDRYEKAEPSKHQFHTSELAFSTQQPPAQTLEQAYLLAQQEQE